MREIVAHAKDLPFASCRPIREPRKSSDIRFDVRQRTWIQRKELRRYREQARNGFWVKRDRTYDQRRAQSRNFFDGFISPAISYHRQSADGSDVPPPRRHRDEISFGSQRAKD